MVKLMGGLGNQMFQYAAARRLAKVNRTSMKMDLGFLLDRTPRENFVYRDYDLNLFNIQGMIADADEAAFFSGAQSVFFKTLSGRMKSGSLFRPVHIQEPSPAVYLPELLRAPKSTYLEGYWQSEKYFKDIEATIRADFTFKEELDEKGQTLADGIRSTDSVCVNVRRGDFVMNSSHGTMSVQYYQDAIDLLVSKIPSPSVFIFSDDIQWCKQNLNFKFPTVVVDNRYAGKKFGDYLHLMTLCKYFIIPNSSFGWWAAWLSGHKNKIVIAPKKWYQTERDTSDLCPEEWIRI